MVTMEWTPLGGTNASVRTARVRSEVPKGEGADGVVTGDGDGSGIGRDNYNIIVFFFNYKFTLCKNSSVTVTLLTLRHTVSS